MKKTIAFYFSAVKYDVLAGVVVFLVALPLCLGIALASGAPLQAGLITGIVGGVLVALLSGSHLSVSGPAAGLTVVVHAAIHQLGSYEAFLLAVFFSGVLQLFLGLVKAGIIASFFPSCVIKGMMAAIGIILMLKQIPHLFGYDADYIGDIAFQQADRENTFSELWDLLDKMHPGAFIVGMLSILLLSVWEYSFFRRAWWLPGPLMVVAAATLLNQFFFIENSDLFIDRSHRVNIPMVNSLHDISSLLLMPDFSQIVNKQVYFSAITIALVASIETLLSIEAVDKLDPCKRITPPNRELFAQGIGNMVAGMLGGLPMTSVIVRSSANIHAGARTRISAFSHGLFLLSAFLFVPHLLNTIPLSALSAVLLMVGYKLNKVSLYRQMYRAGYDQFVPFTTTILAIVFTDLLMGVGIGMAVAVFFILLRNRKNDYSCISELKDGTEVITLRLSEEMSFLNKGSMRATLRDLPEGAYVIIDGSRSKYIDYDVLELIHDFSLEGARAKKIQVKLINIPAI